MKLSYWVINLTATQDLRELQNSHLLLERKFFLSPFYREVVRPGSLKVFFKIKQLVCNVT